MTWGKPGPDDEALKILLECGCVRKFTCGEGDHHAAFLAQVVRDGRDVTLYCLDGTHGTSTSWAIAVWTDLSFHRIKGW